MYRVYMYREGGREGCTEGGLRERDEREREGGREGGILCGLRESLRVH